MKLLFLVGAEGAGHHLFRSILHSHFQQPWFSFEQSWHKCLTDQWTAETSAECAMNTSSMRECVSRFVKKSGYKEVTHLYENASFPFNHPRNSIRRPDLLEFDQQFNNDFDIRYLIIMRNPISMTNSALKRKFTVNPHLQCRIVEDNLLFIAAQMQAIGDEKYRVIHFEDFLSRPTEYVEALSSWWWLDQSLLRNDLKNIRKPTQISEIPKETTTILSDFFSTQRNFQWDGFFRRNPLIR